MRQPYTHYLRLVLLVWLAVLVLTGGAVALGAQRPPAPMFAFAHLDATGTNRMFLYDVNARSYLPIGRLDRIEVVRWFEDGTAIAVSVGLGGHWAVYKLDDGWISMNDELFFMGRIAPHVPQDIQIIVRAGSDGNWDVFTVNPADRSEVPISSLQNLQDAPSLYWSGDDTQLVAVTRATGGVQFSHVNLLTEQSTPLAAFPAGSEIERTYFSADGQWMAVIIRQGPRHHELHMIDMMGGRIWAVSQSVNREGVVGFAPPPQ